MLETIDNLEATIKQVRLTQETTIKCLTSTLHAVAKQAIEADPGIAHTLYWRHPLIPVELIAAILGLPTNEVAQAIGPDPASDTCRTCGAAIGFSSRSGRLAFQRKKKRNREAQCEKCRQAALSGTFRAVEQQVADRQARIRELEQMPYTEYLQTPEWKRRAANAKARVDHHCQLCNNQGELHVHHRTYRNKGNEQYHDLIVLCATCHKKHHEIEP